MQKTMAIMMGIQGSGKSTFYSKHLSEDYVRVNLDTLKTRHQESLLIEECFIEGKSFAFKNELLFSHGINFDALPSWQKRGVGIYWDDVEKLGFNPITKEEVKTTRRTLNVNYELPLGIEYAKYVVSFLERG